MNQNQKQQLGQERPRSYKTLHTSPQKPINKQQQTSTPQQTQNSFQKRQDDQQKKQMFLSRRDKQIKTIKYNDGTIYYGEVENGLREGIGALYLQNGDLIYKGQWQNDQISGKGVLINIKQNQNEMDILIKDHRVALNSKSWDQYIGTFKNGQKEGEGIQHYSNSYFIGQFKNNQIYGIGGFYANNKKRKFGLWKNGILENDI